MSKPRPKKENVLFPGRENYTGPNFGYFAMLHHEKLFEDTSSWNDGVKGRVGYVKIDKNPREVPIRLRNMVCLNGMPELEVPRKLLDIHTKLYKLVHTSAACKSLPAAEERDLVAVYSMVKQLNIGLVDNPKLRKAVLKYLDKVYPAHAWNNESGGIGGTGYHKRPRRRKAFTLKASI